MSRFQSLAAALGIAVGVTLLAGCERPDMEAEQIGYRGVAMETVSNPRIRGPILAANMPPPKSQIPPGPAVGPKAKDIYKNVQVLGDLSVGQFTRLMVNMTAWVAAADANPGPVEEQGCAYCHDINDMASDDKYTKHVARRMTQMTLEINKDWNSHVQTAGVTCYTCHRGKNVPEYLWFNNEGNAPMARGAGDRNNDQSANPNALNVLTSLPFDNYLNNDKTIRVAPQRPLPIKGEKGAKYSSIQSTEATYGLMMHMSNSLGVNCTYCHNSRAFGDWSQSTPARTTAWHGIEMVRSLNGEYLDPLQDRYPPHRLGPTGDAPKVACSTCHQGVNKPLQGADMRTDNPELQ